MHVQTKAERDFTRRDVFLTGGTGFVGGHVARRLVERGHRVRALVRSPALARRLDDLGAELVDGDITEPQSLAGKAAGCDTVIHLVGIIREKPPATYEAVHTRGTAHVVEEAKRAGVARFLHMSALAARVDGTAYQRTKYEGEEIVRRSRLPHAIFRPSIIAGADGDLLGLLFRLVRYLPAVPVIGSGQYRMQPVDVEDVATSFAVAAEREEPGNEAYELGGPHKMTFNRLLEIIAEEMGVRRTKLHVPVALVRPFAELTSSWHLPLPINAEQLDMLLAESVLPGDSNALRDVFEVEPTPFRAVIQRILLSEESAEEEGEEAGDA